MPTERMTRTASSDMFRDRYEQVAISVRSSGPVSTLRLRLTLFLVIATACTACNANQPAQPSAPDAAAADAAPVVTVDAGPQCPNRIRLSIIERDTHIDYGMTGASHDIKLVTGSAFVAMLDCDSRCEECSIRGPIYEPGLAADFMDPRRCENDTARTCTSDTDCGGAPCQWYFSPPMSLNNRLGLHSCTYISYPGWQDCAAGGDCPIEGHLSQRLGRLTLSRYRVDAKTLYGSECYTCQDDPGFRDANRQGRCAPPPGMMQGETEALCDRQGVQPNLGIGSGTVMSVTQGRATSLDCPIPQDPPAPSVQFPPLTTVTVRHVMDGLSTNNTTWTASSGVPCGPGGMAICHCGTCVDPDNDPGVGNRVGQSCRLGVGGSSMSCADGLECLPELFPCLACVEDPLHPGRGICMEPTPDGGSGRTGLPCFYNPERGTVRAGGGFERFADHTYLTLATLNCTELEGLSGDGPLRDLILGGVGVPGITRYEVVFQQDTYFIAPSSAL